MSRLHLAKHVPVAAVNPDAAATAGSQAACILLLALGWKPLCEVHCNGLVGKFLGGP